MSNTPKPMSSIAPYILRSAHQWIIDNNYTPFVLVNTKVPGTQVPQQHVRENGTIVLNLAYRSTEHLVFGDDMISFMARFNGRAEQIFLPINSMLLIFAQETGAGISLQPYHVETPKQEGGVDLSAISAASVGTAPQMPPTETPAATPSRKYRHLSVVK